MVDAFLTAAGENACGTHGPHPGDAAADLAVQLATRYADGHAVVLTDEPTIVDLDLEARLRAAGAAPLRPTDRDWRAALPNAGAAITGCVLAVAATGHVVVAAGPGTPRAASLAPPAHICLVHAERVVPTIGDALAVLDAGDLPSALIWVGGPSRTSDLEMRPTIGVHGPRTVDLIVISA
ncbi:MAG TPA: LUD domain-containing protein [Acidimicrobiia bacterium]|nr:LUD domain-containing protein [Acidimicrobiia bacterium]